MHNAGKPGARQRWRRLAQGTASALLLGTLLLAAPVQARAMAAPSAPPAPADLRAPLAAADQALAAHRYALAYQGYARHAASNPLAQFNLGLFEQNGWGRPADAPAACAWFDKAAHGHVPAAQQFLGDCLARGVGRAPDGAAALHWYGLAAASGLAWADCAAGQLYLDGTLVARDVARALALCGAAARAESVPAMLVLAEYYRAAPGAANPSNPALARYWYTQAAQRHHAGAQWRLGLMLGEGEGGPADLAQARAWLELAASAGHAAAYLPTAILYANAPTDARTGALAAHDLAKVYMWNQAARARTDNPQQLAEIARIDALVKAVMPAQWQADLDARVAAHLARHAPSAAGASAP